MATITLDVVVKVAVAAGERGSVGGLSKGCAGSRTTSGIAGWRTRRWSGVVVADFIRLMVEEKAGMLNGGRVGATSLLSTGNGLEDIGVAKFGAKGLSDFATSILDDDHGEEFIDHCRSFLSFGEGGEGWIPLGIERETTDRGEIIEIFANTVDVLFDG